MGGRGGRSHGGGSRTAPQSSRYDAVERLARQMGIYLNVGSLQRDNINPIYVNETLNSIQYIYTHFPIMTGRVQYIDAETGSSRAYASAGGDGGLHMGLYGRLSERDLQRQWEWDVRSGFHPQGTKPSGIFIHEMGHQIEAYLNARNYGNAWSWGKTSSEIVLRAARKIDPTITGLRDPKVYALASDISRYAVSRGSHGQYPWQVWETLAEAVQDFSSNDMNAKPLSIAIWEELKRRARR